ncbi:nucleotidyltransferase domain-containing protein [Burkholderia guangdongensis]|uniref:nucleotidyltransferase domain-containing protein n=1 Tax=Burkholderia guangdongensis TaxID=1792500 RepID=UPI0015CD5D21
MGKPIDAATAHAADLFLKQISGRYAVQRAILFGSRARHEYTEESDADIAVILPDEHRRRIDVALDMAGVAFDVLLETGILVEALPLWANEIEHPEQFSNPALIESIRREGIPL